MKKQNILKVGVVLIACAGLSACNVLHKKSKSAPAGADYDGDSVEQVETYGAGARHQFKEGSAESFAENPLLKQQTYYYKFDSSIVGLNDLSSVEAHARYLMEHPSARIVIEGHTDERGSREYNIALGERRAMSIAKILQIQGVSEQQIRIVSFGEEKPAKVGHNEAAYRYNRRAMLDYEHY